jgi:hypothetical protein
MSGRKQNIQRSQNQCCDRMIRWQLSPMRQLGATSVIEMAPSWRMGLQSDADVRTKTKYSAVTEPVL